MTQLSLFVQLRKLLYGSAQFEMFCIQQPNVKVTILL